MSYMFTVPYNHGHHRRHRRPQQTPENPAAAPRPPDAMEARCFRLDLLVLHRVHYHPVEGVDVLPDEVLKHDECLHQKILQ